MTTVLEMALRGVGAGHLALCAGSLFIPSALGWKQGLAGVPTLIRQMFWVYAAYVFGFHVCFGLLGLFGTHLLLDGSMLAALVCGFVCVYWVARLVVQFAYFDRKSMPRAGPYRLAEAGLVLAFAAFAGVFGWACAFNLGAS